ncbi:MAG TPA: 2-phosphosulfolactate phosphatase [Gaiellales bacterium]|nr:2-phosphosulfolactate phosphatase [Gaiellales bacterium]
MRIDVAFTPDADGAAAKGAAVAIVIDVLRATTTIACALEQGYRRVLACGEVEHARELAERLGAGAVLAGERACVKPEGFHLGNSPREFTGAPLGETLVLTTTNGTRAIVAAAAHAEAVLIGSLVNLTPCAAAAGRLARAAGGNVLVQCAGIKGAFTMDDAYTAGRFVTELAVWLSEWERSDAARAAEAVAGSFASAGDGLAASQSARNLHGVGLDEDVRFCARESVLDLVPRVGDLDAGVALIEAAT